MPSRRSPAAASTSASWSPSSSFLSRVSRLPRMGANRAPGEHPRQLGDTPHAARADRRRRPQRDDEVVHRRERRVLRAEAQLSALTGSTTASSGSSRGSTPAIVSPSGSTVGMSLLLWTARSISRRSSASSISFTKSRLPPASDRGRSTRLSPVVLMTTMRHGGPPASATRAATARACHSASWLPRVPSRSSMRHVSAGRAFGARERFHLACGARLLAVAVLVLVVSDRRPELREAKHPRDRFGVERGRLRIAERLEL